MGFIFRNWIIILFIYLFTISCNKSSDVTLKLKTPEKKLVIHGFISQEKVHIEIRSTVNPVKTSSNDELNGVTVFLYANDSLLFQLVQKSIYIFESPKTFKPINGVKYKIKATATNYSNVESEEQMLPLYIAFNKPSIKIIDSNLTYKSYKFLLSYSFLDDKKDEAFYVVMKYNYWNGLKIEDTSSISRFNINPYICFNDIPFNGLMYKASEEFSIDSMYQYNFIDSIQLKLFSVSKAYYLFSKSLLDYEISQSSAMYEQPIPVYSNIKNGYGIFFSCWIDSTYINPIKK